MVSPTEAVRENWPALLVGLLGGALIFSTIAPLPKSYVPILIAVGFIVVVVGPVLTTLYLLRRRGRRLPIPRPPE